MNKKPERSYRVDACQLKDEKARQTYNDILEKNIGDIEPTCDLEEHATRLTAAIRSAAETTVPARRTARKPWISEETLKLADEKPRLKQMMNVSAKYTQEYRDFCRKVKKSARQDKEDWIHDQSEQEDKGLNIGNTRQAYSLIKMLGKKPEPRVNVLRNQESSGQRTR